MTIAIISHPDCALHDIEGHPERPARVKSVEKALETYPFRHPVQFYLSKKATLAQLRLAHDDTYLQWITAMAPKQGFLAIDADTIMDAHTLNAALYAAGAVPLAVDLIFSGQAKAVFCNIRPPGHHAERGKAMGFCFFNNVAIGASYALQRYGLKRVAIIDFDVHHGNGTQAIFQDNPQVLYCSSFQHPFYPGYEPKLDNAHILSVPLPAGTGSAVYRQAVTAAWFGKLADFHPDLILFSAGFDAHEHDPLANFMLTKSDYVWLTQEVVKIAKQSCEGRVISVLEGGYDLPSLAACVPAHVDALC